MDLPSKNVNIDKISKRSEHWQRRMFDVLCRKRTFACVRLKMLKPHLVWRAQELAPSAKDMFFFFFFLSFLYRAAPRRSASPGGLNRKRMKLKIYHEVSVGKEKSPSAKDTSWRQPKCRALSHTMLPHLNHRHLKISSGGRFPEATRNGRNTRASPSIPKNF